VPTAPARVATQTQQAPQYGPIYSPYTTLRRPGRARRFFGALFAMLLCLAVPVVSAYVSYKLASGENPFEWPPNMDLSNIFDLEQ